MALSKSQRRAMAAEALGEDVGDVMDVDAIDPTPEPPAAPTVTLTLDQIQGMISAAVTAAVGAQTPQGDIAGAIANALKANRDRIPESTDAEYHGRSEYNPEGKAVPRPTLPCEYWWAVWDAQERRAYPVRDMDPSVLTNDEIRGLAQITPGTYALEKSDGRKVAVNVVDQVDSFGNLLRRQLAFPREQFDKEHRNELGPLKSFRERMTPLAA